MLPWVQTSNLAILVTTDMAAKTAAKSVVRSPVRIVCEPWPLEGVHGIRSDSGVRVEVTDLEKTVTRWVPDITSVLGKNHWGLPLSWAMGMIYAESRGDDKALSSDGGVGLTQVTHPSLKGALTEEQLLVPVTNLTIGLGFLYRIAVKDSLLPRVAATYNAGGVYEATHYSGTEGKKYPNPWAMRCSLGYIDRVVAAANAAERWLRDKAIKGGTYE